MLRLNSIVLIASGIGLVTYSYGQPQSDAVRQLEDVTRIATRIVLNYDRQVAGLPTLDSDAHEAEALVAGDVTNPSVGAPVHAVVANATRPPVSPWTTVVKSADIETPVVRAPNGAADKVRVDPEAATPGAATYVTAAIPVRPVRPIAPAVDDTDTSRAGDAGAFALIRDIQTHLRRTNCYDGPVSGQWTPATQEAMEAFLAVANAALPVQKPDSVLLALVRSHTGTSCVPAWRTTVERATVARATLPAPARKVVVTAAAEPTVAAIEPAARRQRPAGMMSVGAPPPPEPVTSDRTRADDSAVAARKERSRAVALLVEPIEPDADEAYSGTRMIPPPIPRGDIDDDSDRPAPRARTRERSNLANAPTRLVTASLGDESDAYDSADGPSRPAISRQGQTRKQKRRAQARAKRNRPDVWQRRGPPSYAQYKPRRRTWLPRGSVRYQIHQAISGLY